MLFRGGKYLFGFLWSKCAAVAEHIAKFGEARERNANTFRGVMSLAVAAPQGAI